MLFFVSDLHGVKSRFEKLRNQILTQKPKAVLIGGDIMPNDAIKYSGKSSFFICEFKHFLQELKSKMQADFPVFMVILGNTDPKVCEPQIISLEKQNLLVYLGNKKYNFNGYDFYGYSYIPPSPFKHKDWEKYDVSRYIDAGCYHPYQGERTVETNIDDLKWGTIKNDLDIFAQTANFSKSVFLFHCPPYQTHLDRAALDGKMFDNVPLDVNVGSIAIKRFIQANKPLLTLHGHVHESSDITGNWQQKLNSTYMFSAAVKPPNLAIIKFKLEELHNATKNTF